ncbi:MAG: PHP domain-containing protein, partial [Kiritimatiellae bacterium]|nr:PHP domain-containing protein [Kiritimatiellia bacterium]
LRSRVAPLANELMEALKKTGHVQQITVAGSFRRGRDTVGDLDLLAVSDHPSAVMQALVDRSEVAQVLLRGETKTSVRLTMGLQVDLRLVPPESFGAALQYFTGSQAHNIATRRRAQLAGLKQNEYGIFRAEEQIAGATEDEVYQALQLPWIPPELREDRGELALAEQGRLPNLISPADIRGDLHNHSTWSDGAATLSEMACAARKRGWEYLAITDHSKRLTVANGLDEHRLRLQLEQMEEVREGLKGFSLLSGSEVDILEDGSLDLPDSILRELDVVILSVHSKFNLSREKQTTRILRALDNPYSRILGHPTGRLLLTRDPYEVDMERVLEGIRARGCFVECNLNPHRLDLDDRYLARAKALGVPVVLNCDGHSVTDFQHHDDGILQARRAGLEAGDVVNTATITELRNRLRATKR